MLLVVTTGARWGVATDIKCLVKARDAAKASQNAQGNPYNYLVPNINDMEAGKPSTRLPHGFFFLIPSLDFCSQ